MLTPPALLLAAWCFLAGGGALIPVTPCDDGAAIYQPQMLTPPPAHQRYVSSIRIVDGPASVDLATGAVSLPRRPSTNIDLLEQIGRLVEDHEQVRYPWSGAFPSDYANVVSGVDDTTGKPGPQAQPVATNRAKWIGANVLGPVFVESRHCVKCGPPLWKD